MATIALPIFPWPISAERLELVKQAKAELDVNYLVQPIQAVPGVTTRVLAFEKPTMLCNHALTRDPDNYASVLGALTWVLQGDADDPRAVREIDQLRSILGEGVKEITDEVEGVAFR